MSEDIVRHHTFLVKRAAKEIGFDYCGISKAEYLKEESPRLETWLKQKHNGRMAYMENHLEKRLDPTKLVEGARSVISLLYNYFPEKQLPEENNYKIAKYAYGRDYHFVIRKKLGELHQLLKEKIGEIQGRFFVDSAPVLERQWAARSGLGWIGKNTMLINKKQGSFFFIAELISDLELIPNQPIGDYCGTCTRCLEACPTQALTPYKMDASKCISYLTIELKEEIPEGFKGKLNDWIFGCDICQNVCPWNRFSTAHKEPAFEAGESLFRFDKTVWKEISQDTFNEIFRESPLKRAGYNGLRKNILFNRK